MTTLRKPTIPYTKQKPVFNEANMRYLLLILMTLITSVPAAAQNTIFDMKEQCASRASVDAWSYDGTILATGYGGLHGITANWETPRVLARTSRYSNGRLSPNQELYAVFQETIFFSESFNNEHTIEAIKVFSTLNDNVVYSIPWENSWLNMWGYREMFWLNDEQILYEYSDDFVHELDEIRVVNPIEGTTEKWDTAIDILDGGSGFGREYIQFPSPNFNRTIYRSFHPTESRRFWALFDPNKPEPMTELLTYGDSIFAWLPDSSGFVGQITDEDEYKSLKYFDSNGNEIATVLDLEQERIYLPNNLKFSSDGKYLAVKIWGGNLLIVDMKNQELIDTCLSTADNIAWSPDNSQIVFLEPRSGTQNVYVLDITSWSYRAVAKHIVQSTRWDKIIGWREN